MKQATSHSKTPALAGAWFLAIVTLLAVGLTLQDPGLTVDEPINVGHGKRLWMVLSRHPREIVQPAMIDWLFRHGHEHPPLTRLLVGMSHALVDPAPADPRVVLPRGGRGASAVALALLVFLVVRATCSLDQKLWALGQTTDAIGLCGWYAGAALLLMPRVFAHAHFASPEILCSLFFFAGLMAVDNTFQGFAHAFNSKATTIYAQPGKTVLAPLGAGVMVGLALLCKLTAILLPITLVVVALLRWRWRAFGPLVFGSVGALCVFLLGWPWLWPVDLPGYAPGFAGSLQRLREFFGTSVDRAPIYTWYGGMQYPNATGLPPWHYVWIYFSVTVPMGLQCLGIIGMVTAWRRVHQVPDLLLWCLAFAITLCFFTLPIQRYDGERLFLHLFPLWAVFIGLGAATVQRALVRHLRQSLARVLVAMVFLGQSYGLIYYHPYQLSYYNGLVGGLHGAEQIGLEVTYWGDALDDALLNEAAHRATMGENIALLPTLYSGHAYHLTHPKLLAKKIAVIPADELNQRHCRWVLIFHRQSYLQDPFSRQIMARGTIIHETTRSGVWLARLLRLEEAPPAVVNPLAPVDRHGLVFDK